jgi:hypothetical protein
MTTGKGTKGRVGELTAVLLAALVAGSLLQGCAMSAADRAATERAWAERDAEHARECERVGGRWSAMGCQRGGGGP